MDAERSEGSETKKQEEAVVVKVETNEDSENRPAAAEEAEPQAVNGQAADVAGTKETGERAAVENKEVTVEDKTDEEPKPSGAAPPESAESPEKVANSDTKPEGSEQQPVPENIPEPLQTQQAESAPELEPAKQAELEERSAPVETEPLIVVEKAPEQVKVESELHATAEAAQEKVVSSEKPAEASAQVGDGDKPEPAAQMAAGAVKSEQEHAEPPKEENVAPAAGSLSFAILEEEETKDALRVSRTLVVLRGLPGSGKSFLARAIADAYKGQCSVCSADQHGVKPENPKSSADGYKALDDAIVALCSDADASSVLVVVDDTNHTHERLACLGEIAKEYNLITLFLEPQTEWSRDATRLKGKTSRGLGEAQLEAMKSPLEDTSLPLFYGWFLLWSVRERVKCTAMDFLKTLDTLEEFKSHLADCEWGLNCFLSRDLNICFNPRATDLVLIAVTGKAEKEVDLEQYFDAKTALHCTTKFCNYGEANGAKEYAEKSVRNCFSSLRLRTLFNQMFSCKENGALII